jgi:hypothetical protein
MNRIKYGRKIPGHDILFMNLSENMDEKHEKPQVR